MIVTSRVVVVGPMGDSGRTGRKIIVDAYGGMGRHGGGAFAGKDPSKVDRSAAELMALGTQSEALSPNVRLGLTAGVMGGFTTYSTFS